MGRQFAAVAACLLVVGLVQSWAFQTSSLFTGVKSGRISGSRGTTSTAKRSLTAPAQLVAKDQRWGVSQGVSMSRARIQPAGFPEPGPAWLVRGRL